MVGSGNCIERGLCGLGCSDWMCELNETAVNQRSCSSVLNEADVFCLFSESLSAEHELVLSDETEVAAGDSAAAGVFTILAGVRFELVRHVFENE